MLLQQDAHLRIAQIKKCRLEVVVCDVCLLLNLLDCKNIVIVEKFEDDSLRAVSVQNIGFCPLKFPFGMLSGQVVLGMYHSIAILVSPL